MCAGTWRPPCAAILPRWPNASFDCIACGLCSARCPVEETQYNVALLARRLYGRYLAKRSEHLAERVERDCTRGLRRRVWRSCGRWIEAGLQARYNARDIEA